MNNITICIDDERQAKIDCILNSDSEYRTAEELVQFLFDEALQAHYLLYGKCANEYEEGFSPMEEITPQVVGEMTDEEFYSEENNPLMLYDPLDPNVEIDKEGCKI